MSHYTTEKKVAKQPKTEFEIIVSEEDMDELHRLVNLRYTRGVRSIKAHITFKEEDGNRFCHLEFDLRMQ